MSSLECYKIGNFSAAASDFDKDVKMGDEKCACKENRLKVINFVKRKLRIDNRKFS